MFVCAPLHPFPISLCQHCTVAQAMEKLCQHYIGRTISEQKQWPFLLNWIKYYLASNPCDNAILIFEFNLKFQFNWMKYDLAWTRYVTTHLTQCFQPKNQKFNREMQKNHQEIQKNEIWSGLNQVCDYAADPVVPTKKSKKFTEKCKKFSKISKKWNMLKPGMWRCSWPSGSSLRKPQSYPSPSPGQLLSSRWVVNII